MAPPWRNGLAGPGMVWLQCSAPRPGHLSNQPVHPAQNPGKALEAPEDLGGRNSHNLIYFYTHILDIFVEPFGAFLRFYHANHANL